MSSPSKQSTSKSSTKLSEPSTFLTFDQLVLGSQTAPPKSGSTQIEQFFRFHHIVNLIAEQRNEELEKVLKKDARIPFLRQNSEELMRWARASESPLENPTPIRSVYSAASYYQNPIAMGLLTHYGFEEALNVARDTTRSLCISEQNQREARRAERTKRGQQPDYDDRENVDVEWRLKLAEKRVVEEMLFAGLATDSGSPYASGRIQANESEWKGAKNFAHGPIMAALAYDDAHSLGRILTDPKTSQTLNAYLSERSYYTQGVMEWAMLSKATACMRLLLQHPLWCTNELHDQHWNSKTLCFVPTEAITDPYSKAVPFSYFTRLMNIAKNDDNHSLTTQLHQVPIDQLAQDFITWYASHPHPKTFAHEQNERSEKEKTKPTPKKHFSLVLAILGTAPIKMMSPLLLHCAKKGVDWPDQSLVEEVCERNRIDLGSVAAFKSNYEECLLAAHILKSHPKPLPDNTEQSPSTHSIKSVRL